MFNWSERFDALEDLLITLPAWKSWIDSTEEDTLRSRVSYPLRSADLHAYPYINLSPGRARSVNTTGGYDSSANFQTAGTMTLRLWSADESPDDPAASFRDFDTKATALLDDLILASHEGPLIFTEFTGDDPDIVHTHDNAFILGQSSEDAATWMASVILHWGVL